MHLWTEYEGRTIAGSYTLGKLLRSEGRNGFFATSNTTGNSAVIRLTESHFDEEEVLKRWRQVAELHQANLIEIEKVGQTRLDDVALTYALMERNDANLEDVLKERPLTAAETGEVAKSVLAAVETLHASGLVHEHIEPVNVLAVGEVVKLRSDCVRECVADGEFTSEEACAALRKRDLHDFGTLLLRCLTLERELTPSVKLAEPFNRVIPGAIEGTLSLAQLDSILNPPMFLKSQGPPAYGDPPAASGVGAAGAARIPVTSNGARPAAAGATSAAIPAVAPAAANEPSMRLRASPVSHHPETAEPPSKNLWLFGGGLLALGLLFWVWHLFGAKSARPGASAGKSSVVTQPAPAVVAPATPASTPRVIAVPAAASSVASTASGSSVASSTAGHAAPGWYVIAYTYNREDQARAKAARISHRRGGLHAEPFSPTSRGPHLVSLGGPMSQGEAEGLLRRARRSGMPRDTFMRKY